MAHTAHTDPEMMREIEDPPEVLQQKIEQLVELIKASKNFVIFTGAGVSTSAGIPDFRGPDGKWTLEAQNRTRDKPTTPTFKAIPTVTHMSIVQLLRSGILKYLISQNCDGLHRRSGVNPNQISELHGNSNIEFCETCGFEYLRDFHCLRIKRGRDHFTGRYCDVPHCGGRLMNSTIDFGQDLPHRPLELAYEHSMAADLHLVLGSSLTVQPACKMPKITSKSGKLVIVNLQRTPLDDRAFLRIHAKCDTVMGGVMKLLGIPVPNWLLQRRVVVSHSIISGNYTLDVTGVDAYIASMPATIFSRVEVQIGGTPEQELPKEPFQVTGKLPENVSKFSARIRLHFLEHFKEPPVDLIEYIADTPVGQMMYTLLYDPTTRSWEVQITATPKEYFTSPVMPSSRKEIFNHAYITHSILPHTGTTPSSRSWVAMTLVPNTPHGQCIALSGGTPRGPDGEKSLTQPWISLYNQSSAWVHRVASPSEADLPWVSKPRWGHTMTQISESKAYLIGGWDSQCQYEEVQCYDFSSGQLSLVNLTTNRIPPRAGHTATLCKNGTCIVVFGGAVCEEGNYRYLNDVHVLSLADNSWSSPTLHGDSPPPRAQHCAVCVGDKLVFLGGCDGRSVLTDCVMLDTGDWHWSYPKVYGDPMPPMPYKATEKFRVFPTRGIAHKVLLGTYTFILYNGPQGTFLIDALHWKRRALTGPPSPTTTGTTASSPIPSPSSSTTTATTTTSTAAAVTPPEQAQQELPPNFSVAAHGSVLTGPATVVTFGGYDSDGALVPPHLHAITVINPFDS